MKYFRELENVLFYAPHWVQSLLINLYGRKLAKNRFGGDFNALLEELKLSQSLPVEAIMERKLDSLRSILEVAYSHSKYYHKLFVDYGFDYKSVTSFQGLTSLPLLTKDIIRDNYNDLVVDSAARNKIKTITHWTSGTTGAKLKFMMPAMLHFSYNYALYYRALSWAGISPKDKHVTLGGRLFTKKSPYYVYNKAENQLLLSIHHLNETTAGQFCQYIIKFKPLYLQGHPTGISFLADYALRENVKIHIPCITTTGETLFPHQRADIKKAFNSIVLETYGSGESVIAAYQCQLEHGFHEASELGHIELLPTDNMIGDQEAYSIIGTSFLNNVMPFIRYEMNDLAIKHVTRPLDCKVNLPLVIDTIIGRVDDYIINSTGERVFPVSVRMAIKPLLKPFESYQFIQEDSKKYVLKINSLTSSERKMAIIAALKNSLGEDISISILDNSDFLTAGGKVRTVINNLI